MRVKRGTTAHARHAKMLRAAKGMQHNRTRSFRLATYGRLIADIKAAGVALDRKVLAELAVNEPQAFAAVVKHVTRK